MYELVPKVFNNEFQTEISYSIYIFVVTLLFWNYILHRVYPATRSCLIIDPALSQHAQQLSRKKGIEMMYLGLNNEFIQT